MFSAFAKKGPKHGFFSTFKESLKGIKDSNKVSRNFPRFLDEINQYLAKCRSPANAYRWDESMFGSAFCKYLSNKIDKDKYISDFSTDLRMLFLLIHPNHRNWDSIYDERNEYSVTLSDLCEYRKIILRSGDINFLAYLKTILTTYFALILIRTNNYVLYLYWVRLLAEFSVITIPGELPWPTEYDFNEIIKKTIKNPQNRELLLTFFNQERERLRALLLIAPSISRPPELVYIQELRCKIKESCLRREQAAAAAPTLVLTQPALTRKVPPPVAPKPAIFTAGAAAQSASRSSLAYYYGSDDDDETLPQQAEALRLSSRSLSPDLDFGDDAV